jgi:ABC-type Zn uptake system ZnuABC Zn-binding protein ZnuA
MTPCNRCSRVVRETSRRFAVLVAALTVTLVGVRSASAESPLNVFTTLRDLGDLAKAVGGDQVEVTSMVKGPEDAHFIEAKPSFIKQLSQADLFVINGMDLEAGYVPLLLKNARNGRVLPGSPGYLDASVAMSRKEVPAGEVDRSMGDVHPLGNPHYLLDPLNGVRVAGLIRDKLIQLRPAKQAYFEANFDAFRQKISLALVGEPLAAKYDAEKLAILFVRGKLASFLQQQGDAQLLGGWLGLLLPFYGTKVVDDHNMWPYFAERFGLQVVGHMEPKPGIPPTTSHLSELVAQMRAQGVKLIIAAPYYDPRHARFLSEATGAKVAYLAHEVGARQGADDYIAMVNYNVNELANALRAAS